MEKFIKTAFFPADILIPKNTEMEKWSVVACDQYTSEPKYWSDVEELVGNEPSTLHIVFPEIYLEDKNYVNKIDSINKSMQDYIDNDIFETVPNSFIYVERTVANGKIRKGLIGAVDLEAYDYTKASTALIRATEGTVLERIPPRVKIRINAPLELPHIMLLIDDPDKTVIEPINKNNLTKVYDFNLMQNSGHIEGYKVTDNGSIADALLNLYNKQSGDNAMLYAVGDGNHSLATAKECWEQTKKELPKGSLDNHPARYALVELVNIHDESLEFEPIHRVVFGCDPSYVISSFMNYYDNVTLNEGSGQCIKFTYKGTDGKLFVKNAPNKLEVGTLQKFLDYYCAENNCRIDYIHGDDVVKKLASNEGNIGFMLPAMEKSDLFKAVISDGALPRKTFSMGEASEKRFYLECRKIK